MDNSKLENEAEDLVKHILAKANILFAKSNFDAKGIDLLALKSISDTKYHSLHIQSKGRNLSSRNSSIKIPIEYVVETFVCFVYLKVDNDAFDYIYIYFFEDISQWKKSDSHYSLYIPKLFRENDSFKNALYSSEKIEKLKELLELGDLLENNYLFQSNFLPIDVSFDLWKLSGGLPDPIVTKWLFNNLDLNYTLFSHDLFLLFLGCKHLEELEMDYVSQLFSSIKGNLNSAKSLLGLLDIVYEAPPINRFNNPWLTTYNYCECREFAVRKSGKKLNVLYCYLGDREEFIEIALLEDGSYLTYYQLN